MKSLTKGFRIARYDKFTDHRGQLIVFLKTSDLPSHEKEFGQIYFVTFKNKSVIRGNHYHYHWREWFGIVAGCVKVVLEDVRTKQKTTFTLDAKRDKYVRLEIDPYIAHAFISKTKNAVLLNYANGEWHNRDTFPYKLL